MTRFCRTAIWTCVALAGFELSASAATFTTPLPLVEATGPEGAFLTAVFDFDRQFTEIEAVSIHFVMSEGFQGTSATTGNSTYTRSLNGVLHDGDVPMKPDTDGVYAWPFGHFGKSKSHIDAGEAAEFRFRQYVYTPPGGGETRVYPPWPDFLLAGQGRFSFVDISTSSFHPIGNPELGSSTTTWMAPDGLESATLTIVGTAVPEPGSALLALFAIAACVSWRRLRRKPSRSYAEAGSFGYAAGVTANPRR
jgi:hypothetical protein